MSLYSLHMEKGPIIGGVRSSLEFYPYPDDTLGVRTLSSRSVAYAYYAIDLKEENLLLQLLLTRKSRRDMIQKYKARED